MNDIGKSFKADLPGHGDRYFADKVSGMAGHDCGADNAIRPFLDKYFYKTFGFTIHDGAIYFIQRDLVCVYRNVLGMSIFLIKANMGDFRIGIRTPGQGQMAETFSAKKQGVLYRNTSCGIGCMCELPVHTDIPCGIYVWVCRTQEIIHLNAFRGIKSYSCILKGKVLDIGPASGSHQNFIGFDRLFSILRLDSDPFQLTGFFKTDWIGF